MPTPSTSAGLLDVPEIVTLCELRKSLARGRMPAIVIDRRPEDYARWVAFRVVAELLRLLEEQSKRVRAGERVRVVERPHPTRSGQLILEFRIEDVP